METNREETVVEATPLESQAGLEVGHPRNAVVADLEVVTAACPEADLEVEPTAEIDIGIDRDQHPFKGQ